MKKIIFALALILSITIIVAEGQIRLNLNEGKNNITISEDFMSIHASRLIEKYPSIESISTTKYSNTYGYINTLGGIGTDILIEPGKEYEIYSSTNQTIALEA